MNIDTETSGVQVKLVVGKAFGYQQDNIPLVPGLENMFLISVEFHDGVNVAWICPPLADVSTQVGLYVSSGSAIVNDQDSVSVGEMLLQTGDKPLKVQSKEPGTKVAINSRWIAVSGKTSLVVEFFLLGYQQAQGCGRRLGET